MCLFFAPNVQVLPKKLKHMFKSYEKTIMNQGQNDKSIITRIETRRRIVLLRRRD
jgi:hypothetical protein